MVDPRAQKYPAVHGPLHPDEVSPVLLPYRPASQDPQEVAAPTLNLPTGHMVVAPLVQKKPAGQGMLEGDVEPSGHENPAAQGPVQEDDVMAAVAP